MTRSRFLIVMATLLVSTATVSDCRYRGGSENRCQYERNNFHNPLPVMVIFALCPPSGSVQEDFCSLPHAVSLMGRI